jgi:hypothetical protein
MLSYADVCCHTLTHADVWQASAMAAKQRFYDADGDYAGLLRLYREWAEAGGMRKGLGWCKVC